MFWIHRILIVCGLYNEMSKTVNVTIVLNRRISVLSIKFSRHQNVFIIGRKEVSSVTHANIHDYGAFFVIFETANIKDLA